MFCYKCGNKIPDDSKFCPECGTKFDIGSSSENNAGNKSKSENLTKENTEKGKKSLFRIIISPQVYYPAMIVLFILAWVAGKSKSTGDTDLAQFIGKSEQEVAESFGVQINELSMYPDENAIVVTCEEGAVSCINVSETASDYSFEGFKYGDTFDKNIFDEKYTFYDSLEVDGNTVYVYEGKSMADSLSIFVDSTDKVSQIMYMAGLSATECLGNDDENDSIDYEETYVESSETENAEQTDSEIESIDIDYSGEYISIDGSQQLYLDLYDAIDSDGSIGNLFMYEGENLLYDTPYYVSTKEPDAFQDCYIRTYVFYDGETPYYLGFTNQDGEVWIDYDSENSNWGYFTRAKEDGVLYSVKVTASDGYVNIREEGNINSDIIDTANTGEILPVYAEEDNWLQIGYEGNLGWVATSQVEKY